MKDNAQKKLDYQFSLFSNLRKFLLSRGFDINFPTYCSVGMRMSGDSLGILLCEDQNAKSQKNLSRFFRRFMLPSPRKFIGIIWFYNIPRGAGEKNWVFEMDGNAHVDLARKMVKDMANEFNVSIKFCRDPDDY